MRKIIGLFIVILLMLGASDMSGQSNLPIKIISYNIWNGFEGDSLRRARFVEWTRSQSADIVVLTELVSFKEKDLVTLGKVCGFPHTALLKEEGYPVGGLSKGCRMYELTGCISI